MLSRICKIKDRNVLVDNIYISSTYSDEYGCDVRKYGQICVYIDRIDIKVSNPNDIQYIRSLFSLSPLPKDYKFELRTDSFRADGCFIRDLSTNIDFLNRMSINVAINVDYIEMYNLADRRDEIIDYILDNK